MVETVPPLLGAGVRFVLAGAAMYLWLLVRRGPDSVRIAPRELAACTLIGVLLLFGGNGLVTIAEQDVPSGLAALIIASVPLWVAILRATTGQSVAAQTIAGVFIGFAGVAVLVMPGEGGGVQALGFVLLVIASISWAVGSFVSGSVPMPKDKLVATAAQMLCGGALMTAAGVVGGETGGLDLGAVSLESALAFAYLVVIGSLVAFTAYVWLLANAPISKVATYAYVNPVVAIFLGWAILGEQVGAITIVSTAVIVASVALVVRRESQPAEPAGGLAEART